jgi:hypothetical protein
MAVSSHTLSVYARSTRTGFAYVAVCRPSETCSKAGDAVAPPPTLPTQAPFGMPPAEAQLANIGIVNAKSKAKPDPIAPKPDLPPKTTDPVGGSTGVPCDAKCSDGAYIKIWKLRTSALVNSIQGLCTDGNWLKLCGGEGGIQSEVDGDSHVISVRFTPRGTCRACVACTRVHMTEFCDSKPLWAGRAP